MMTTMRDDQIWCKNNLLGTIYFKNTMRDTTVPNLQLFSFEDSKQIRALLKFIPSNNPDFTSDLDCLIYDLNILVRECEFDTNRLKIIQMIQDNYRVIDIARELKTSRQNVYQVYSNIIRQIILKYKSKKEDWLYLNYIKGVYKQCTECGETKLISNFNNSYYMCKQCKCIYDRVRRAK